MIFAVIILDGVFEFVGQHEYVIRFGVVFYLPFYLSHLSLQGEEVQRSHGLVLTDGLRLVKLKVSKAIVSRIDVES